MIRSRGPLPLRLYVAALEGRMIWQDGGGFAMLDPPLVATAGPRPLPWPSATLRMVDRWWEMVLFVCVPVLLVLAGLVSIPLAHRTTPGLVLLLAALIYIALLMTSMLVRGLTVGFSRRPDRVAVGILTGDHWSLSLLHQENEARADELLDQVRARLTVLVTGEVRDAAVRRGARVGPVRVVDTLVCLTKGISTEPMRRWVAAVAGSVTPLRGAAGVVLLLADVRADERQERPKPYVPIVRLCLFAIAVLLCVLPLPLIDAERSACPPVGCGAALTSYGRAWEWLAWQFLWQNTSDLRPSTGNAVVYGFLVHFLLPTLVLVGLVAWGRLAAGRRADIVLREESEPVVHTHTMIMTVTAAERDAVLAAAEEVTGHPATQDFSGSVAVHQLGVINGARLSLVQAGEQGPLGPAGALLTTDGGRRTVRPDYTIITGICYGLRRDEQALGDILVSQRVQDVDHVRLTDQGVYVVEEHRGENLQPSHVLLGRCQAAQTVWTGPRVHVGLMLAASKLVDSPITIGRLQGSFSRAIGGDMEAAAFHAAARRGDVHWIVIKAISDWGDQATAEQRYAQTAASACNAARFVVHMARIGALNNRPSDLVDR